MEDSILKLETFSEECKSNNISEKTFQIIESDKINILLPFYNQKLPNGINFIKNYVSKVWNEVGVLSYCKGVNEKDNNFYLLRLKDFLIDLYATIFTSLTNDISLHDIFNLMKFVAEVGTSWIEVGAMADNMISTWIKKVESSMNCILKKGNEIKNMVNNDNKFYKIFIDYLNFYFSFFIFNDSAIQKENLNFIKEDELIKILCLVKPISFRDDIRTKNFVINIMKAISTSNKNKEKEIFEAFGNLENKQTLPKSVVSGIYKLYVNYLIDEHMIEKAEENIKIILKILDPHSKDELDFFMYNLFILIEKNERDQVKDMFQIIFESENLTINIIEKLLLKLVKLNYQENFLETFADYLLKQKQNSFGKSKIVFTYENLLKNPMFDISFLYIFFKSILEKQNALILQQFEDTGNALNNVGLNYITNNENFFEFFKNLCEAFLENVAQKSYVQEDVQDNNFEYLVPSLLHNIVTFFLKADNSPNSFANFYLCEILQKFKKDDRISYYEEFLNLSIDIFIQKKDMVKLRSIINDIEEDDYNKYPISYYANIILLIGEGLKFGSQTKIDQICENMNKINNLDIEYYIKIFSFIYQNNIQDINLYAILLKNYTTKFIYEYNTNTTLKDKFIKIWNKDNNMYSLIDCYYEVFYFASKINGFYNHLPLFSDVLENLSNFVENLEYNPETNINTKCLCSSLSNYMDFIFLLVDIKNSKNLSPQSFPEYFLLYYTKITNFLFKNFQYYFEKEFIQRNIDNLRIECFNNINSMFELFQNLKIFTISYLYNSTLNNNQIENEDKRKEEFSNIYNALVNYNNNLNLASNIISSKFNENNPEELNLKNKVMEKITTLFSSTNTTEFVLEAQLYIKTQTKENINVYIQNILSKYYSKPKLIFLVNNILYNNGHVDLSYFFLKSILEKIFTNFNELFTKVFSLEDIFDVFQDIISISNEFKNEELISNLKNYIDFINNLFRNNINYNYSQQLEWLFYQLYQVITSFKISEENREEVIMKVNQIKELYQSIKSNKDKTNVLMSIGDMIETKLNEFN